MSNEEAIAYIKQNCYGDWCEDDWRDAMDMAIKALEQRGNTVDLFNLTEEERQQNQWYVQGYADAVRERKQCQEAISRQAAINAADNIIERDTSGNNDVVKAMTAWKMYVEALPSVQPEIIHCLDCRYMHEDTIFGQCWCNKTSGCSKVNKDDFCSKAERRTDERLDQT